MVKWVDFKTVSKHPDLHDVLARCAIEGHGKGIRSRASAPFTMITNRLAASTL